MGSIYYIAFLDPYACAIHPLIARRDRHYGGTNMIFISVVDNKIRAIDYDWFDRGQLKENRSLKERHDFP